MGKAAETLRVDFLGQNFACYFLQLAQSARGLDASTERAFGRLYELQAWRKFVRKPKKSLGLPDDKRPTQFELVMVGQSRDPVQRRAINIITALADHDDIRARPLPSAQAAAEHVMHMERQAA